MLFFGSVQNLYYKLCSKNRIAKDLAFCDIWVFMVSTFSLDAALGDRCQWHTAVTQSLCSRRRRLTGHLAKYLIIISTLPCALLSHVLPLCRESSVFRRALFRFRPTPFRPVHSLLPNAFPTSPCFRIHCPLPYLFPHSFLPLFGALLSCAPSRLCAHYYLPLMTVQYDGQESPTAEDRIEKSSTEHQEKMVSAEAQNSADENDGEISDHDRDHDRNHEQPSSPPHQEHHRSPRDGGHYSSHPSDERPPSPGLPLDHQEDPHRSRESDAQKPDSSAGAEQTTEPGRNHVQSAPARDPEGRNHPDDHAPRENHPDDHPPGGNHPENHPPGRNHPDDHPPGIVNLFVRNVAKHVMEDQLVELFSKVRAFDHIHFSSHYHFVVLSIVKRQSSNQIGLVSLSSILPCNCLLSNLHSTEKCTLQLLFAIPIHGNAVGSVS